jgi:hypothetical protein
MRVVPAGRIHRCDICGRIAAWDDGWRWYGSLLDAEDGDAGVLFICSDACRAEHADDEARLLQDKRRRRGLGRHRKGMW